MDCPALVDACGVPALRVQVGCVTERCGEEVGQLTVCVWVMGDDEDPSGLRSCGGRVVLVALLREREAPRAGTPLVVALSQLRSSRRKLVLAISMLRPITAAFRPGTNRLATGVSAWTSESYEKMAAFWPTAPADDPFTQHLNSTPKYVTSRTLERAEWEPR